jgi:hypothetical protein
MDIHTIANSFFILVGAIIMLVSIVGSKGLVKMLPLVSERQRKHITLYLKLHRALMLFFLCGYLVVLVAFALHYSFISETFVSLIFLFGAIFVFVGVSVQTRLLAEVQKTLQGILPICCKCKKIRVVDGNHRDPKAWKSVEHYITEKTDVGFTHGYCPECYEEEKKNLQGV